MRSFQRVDILSPKTLILVAIVLGASLRLTVYLQNRSFIIDEANLARNIVEKNYLDFFSPLEYEQYSPPLFSCLLKTMTKLGGVNEYSLTFISLLAGMASLILLFLIGRKIKIDHFSLIYLILLFGFSPIAIRYSTELKQYSLDAFLCLLFVFWYLQQRDNNFNLNYVIQMATFGSIAIWLSMPIVFILATIGFQLIYRFLKTKDVKLEYLVLIGMMWSISFGLYYFSILRADAGTDYLQNFHQKYFFSFLPLRAEAWSTNVNLLLGLMRSVTDKTTVSLIGCFLFFSFGINQLWKENRTALSTLLLPFLLCLIASHFRQYSLLTRLTIFLIPLLCLVYIYGFSRAWSMGGKSIKIVLVIYALLTLVNKKAFEYFYNPLEIEDSKTTLTFLKNHHQEEELIFVHHSAVPAFLFYNELHDKAFRIENYKLGKWDELAADAINQDPRILTEDNFWLYFSHTEPEARLQKDFESVEMFATKIKEKRSVQSIVQQYKMD